MDTSVRSATVGALRERIQCVEGGATHRRAVLPFGIKAIDERVPEGGLALGALHEVAGAGTGAVDGTAAALFTAGIAGRTPGARIVVRDPSGSIRASAGASRTHAGPRDLRRGWQREVGPCLFRRSAALPRSRRGCRRSCPPFHDSFAQTTARRGRLWRDRPRTAALAPTGRSR